MGDGTGNDIGNGKAGGKGMIRDGD